MLAFLFMAAQANAQIGAILTGSGPVHRSFGGVSAGTAISPTGSLFWNPATLTGFERSELEAGAELVFANTEIESRFAANSLGLGIPAVDRAGTTHSDSGAFALPNIGLVYHPENSRFTLGFGAYALAGFGADYAGSAANPLLDAPAPNGLGFGPAYSDYQVLQISTAIAYRLTDRLTIAVAPAVNLGFLRLDPALFAGPDDANGDGFGTFPAATHSQTTWGGGFLVGMYYKTSSWGLGASVKSPQWFDTYRYNASDELGRPRALTFGLDLPMIVSLGASYTGLENWIFGADVRYIDYENANGFGERGATVTGGINGIGLDSIFAVAAGVQYQMTDRLSLRLGYSFNENPVPNELTSINAVSSVVVKHTLFLGASWNVTDDLTLSLAAGRGFENSIEGPLNTAVGPVPNTQIRSAASADFVVLGATVKFGARQRCEPCVAAEPYGKAEAIVPESH